jgi:hypothetical protein
LHARRQTPAVLDTTTGEVMEKTLTQGGSNVRGKFYSTLPGPVRVGIEATVAGRFAEGDNSVSL